MQKRKAIAALVASLLLIAVEQTPSIANRGFTQETKTSAAASLQASTKCRNQGPVQKLVAVGSQVDGRYFTICAAVSGQTTKTTKQSGKSKQAAKRKTKSTKLDAHVFPTGQITVQTIKVSNHTQLVFKPKPPRASKKPGGKLRVGQYVTFTAKRKTLYGYSYTQGRKLGVRFVPIKTKLVFSDGVTKSAKSLRRSFEKTGTYTLVARVTFAPYYRWLKAGEWVTKTGAKWVRDPGTISLNSNVVTIRVVQLKPAESKATKPVLVAVFAV